MSNRYYLTQEGLEELQKELNYLKTEKRPAVINALKEARALGDLSENAEYDAAIAEQAEVEGRISQLEVMIEKSEIIEQASTDKVSIGSKVTIQYVEDNETDTYTIVGTSEADPFANKISNESPIAKAILNLKVGDVATVVCDAGNYQVKVLEIA